MQVVMRKTAEFEAPFRGCEIREPFLLTTKAYCMQVHPFSVVMVDSKMINKFTPQIFQNYDEETYPSFNGMVALEWKTSSF